MQGIPKLRKKFMDYVFTGGVYGKTFRSIDATTEVFEVVGDFWWADGVGVRKIGKDPDSKKVHSPGTTEGYHLSTPYLILSVQATREEIRQVKSGKSLEEVADKWCYEFD